MERKKYSNRLFFSVIFLSMILIGLLVFIPSFFVSREAILSEMISSNCIKLSTSNNLLYQKILSITNICINLSDNYEIKTTLKDYNNSTILEQFYKDKYLNNLLVEYESSHIEISSIKIYIDGKELSSELIQSTDKIANTEWMKALQDSKYYLNIIPSYTADDGIKKTYTVSATAAIENPGQRFGYIEIILSRDFFDYIYLDSIRSNPASSAYIIDNNGNILTTGIYKDNLPLEVLAPIFTDIAQKSNNGYITHRINGKKYSFFYSNTNGYGLKTVEFMPYYSIDSVSALFFSVFSIGILVFLIALLAAYVIMKLFKTITLSEKYQFEYLVLREKINPHFLYNLLDAISWNIYKTSPQTSKTLHDVASLYRKAIKTGTYVTVSEETDYIRSYLEMTKSYLNKNINFSIECQPDIKELFIPGFILQPIVENSIKHGFINRSGECRIEIDIRKENNNLCIRISDNGNGIPKEKLESIMSSDINDHMGISNIKKRIRILCGSKYGLTYDSELMKKTTAIINLPIIRELPESNRNEDKNV